MMPAVVVPSPQSIVALKSLRGAVGLASTKVATWPLKGTPIVTLIGLPETVRAASVTVAVVEAEAVEPPSSVTVTEIVKLPSSL